MKKDVRIVSSPYVYSFVNCKSFIKKKKRVISAEQQTICKWTQSTPFKNYFLNGDNFIWEAIDTDLIELIRE